MPKRSNEFQKLVADMYKMTEGMGAEVEESALIKERSSGADREVDILISGQFAGTDVKIAIECRDRAKTDTVEWIDGLVGKYQDLPISKIVAISNSGFSKAAVEKAESHDIELITVEEAENIDWAMSLALEGTVYHHEHRLLHICTYNSDGDEVSHSQTNEEDETTHNNPLAELLYPTLLTMFRQGFELDVDHKIREEVAKLGWERTVDEGPKRYCEMTYNDQITVKAGDNEIVIDKLMYGIGTTFSYQKRKPYSKVIKNTAVANFDFDQVGVTITQSGAGAARKILIDIEPGTKGYTSFSSP